MNQLRPYLPWVLGIAIGFGLYWLYSAWTAPTPIAQAIADDKVQTQVAAVGSDGNRASITLSLPGGSTSTVTVVIPAGTVLYATAAGGQRLIVAAPVTFTLTSNTPSVTQQVETFCMDEFATTPTEGVALAFVPGEGGGGGTTTEETEPLHKLLECMASGSLPESDKQLAVWAVSSDMLKKTRADAISFVSDGLAEQMAKERHDQLVQKKPEAQRLAPTLSSERIDELIENEYQASLSDIRQIAASKAQEQVDNLILHDKSVLTSCGYSAEDMPIFS